MEISKSKETALTKIKLPPNITKTSWKTSLTKWAKEKGFQQIGKGGYGLVFYSPANPDIVIKVFSDKSYNFWYKIAKANQDNPYVLKFKGKPVKIAPDLWAVRIEKLTLLNTSRFKEIKDISIWLSYIAQKTYGIPLLPRFNLYNRFNFTYDMITKIRENFIDSDLEEILTDILWNLSKGENSHKYQLDFGPANVMLRGNQLVITDPLAPMSAKDRKELNLPKPSTNEDASFDKKYKSIDIFKMFPEKKEEAFDSNMRDSNMRDSNMRDSSMRDSSMKDSNISQRRKELISDRSLKRVLIGSKDGPEFSAFYCENTRMFLPSFNIRE